MSSYWIRMTQSSQYWSGTQTQREPAFSQNTNTGDRFSIFARHSSQYDYEEQDLTKKADECVQYILFCCLSERKAIVKRADLNKHVIKEMSRRYKEILKMVGVRLEEVFGIELVELDINDKAEKVGIRTVHEFDPDLNKPQLTENAGEDMDPAFMEQFKYSMLMIALSLIFMNENEINADLFWDSMKRLDVNRDEKKHKYLGDVYKYFTVDLVKEGYLEHDIVKGYFEHWLSSDQHVINSMNWFKVWSLQLSSLRQVTVQSLKLPSNRS